MGQLVTGDSGDKVRITCYDGDGVVLNLTGYTVRIYFALNGGAPQKRTMTVTDAAAGKAEYQFANTELTAKGMITYEIELTDGSSKVTTSDPATLTVRDRLFPEGA